MKRASLTICLLMLALLCMPLASAATLTAGNTTLVIDPTSQAGATTWLVDSVDVLFQQWFWYRIGATGGEHSIDTISAPVVTQSLPNMLSVTYTDPGVFSIGVQYLLTGGAAGTHTADVAETITINNLSATALDLHFFQYSDFDLVTSSDTVQIMTTPFGDSVRQTPPSTGLMINENVVTPAATRWEANTFANTLNSLNDGSPTTLNDVSTAGPGDATWAFEWDTTVAANGTFIISKDKRVAPNVPEPAAIGLLGGVLLLVARKLRARVA